MNLKLLWYCTKSDLKLYKTRDGDYTTLKAKDNIFGYKELNGKIACVSDYEVEEVKEIYCCGCLIQTKTMCHEELLGRSCLTDEEFNEYKPNYAIHIKNLNIFDKPKELNAFYKSTNEITFEPPLPLIKAPQNMCYAYDKYGNKYVVISVRPQWLCLILNGLKDVELRRKVLKEML